MNPEKFAIGIKAIIIQDGKVLLLKDPRYNGWDVPGGKIDQGENIEQALKRELKEELGITNFKMGEILGAHIRQDYNNNGSKLMLIFYKVYAKIQKIKLSHEHDNFAWLTLAEFKKNTRFRNEGVKSAIEKAL